MRAAIRQWVPALAPAAVLAGLVVLDPWVNEQLAPAGVVSGMGLMALLIGLLWWQRRSGARSQTLQALQAGVLSVAETAVGVVLVFLLAAPLTLWLPRSWAVALAGDERAADLSLTLLLGVAVLVAARALWRATAQATSRAQAERDAATARAELAEREQELVRAELQLLRAQIEPHFLWNTLAHVEYLVRKDAGQAQQMLAQLNAYLRANVATGSRRQGSTLASEFASVRAYLGLMQFRMGERLRCALELPDDLAAQDFPPLILQTLVENAIKHGLEPKPGAAVLRVRAHGDGARLRLEVEDNGVGLQPQPRTRGTQLGLRNVRDRLRALYGAQASLTIEGLQTGGVRVRVEWPRQEVSES